MQRKGIHSKALLLLMVFSLNTVVSFACSLGGLFHSFHYHTSSLKQHGQHHKVGHHDNASFSHHQEEQVPEKPADDCCSRNVIELEKSEKEASRVIEAPDVPFLTSFLISYEFIFSQLPIVGKTVYPDFVRWRLLVAIQDLRIIIQSFQI